MANRSRIWSGCILLAIAAVLVFLGRWALPGSKQSSAKPNIIFVSIDTLRADHLSAYGYSRPTSPFLAELAKESVLFRNAISSAPWTLPSHVSMFSGLHPSTHGVAKKRQRIRNETKLLAEYLEELGYRNFAFTGGAFLSSPYGFARGFEVFESSTKLLMLGRHFPELEDNIGSARKALDGLKEGEPYFLFLHTYHTHTPYYEAPPYGGFFKSRGAVPTGDISAKANKGRSFSGGELLDIADRYDSQIRRVDDALKDFFADMRKRADWERTIVLITADHGEELYERGAFGHGRINPYNMRIPLLIRVPGLAPREVQAPVGHVDLLPTLLDYLGIAGPDSLPGSSLRPLLEGKALSVGPKFRFAERLETKWGEYQRAFIDGSRLFLEVPKSRRRTVFLSPGTATRDKGQLTPEDLRIFEELESYGAAVPKGEAPSQKALEKKNGKITEARCECEPLGC